MQKTVTGNMSTSFKERYRKFKSGQIFKYVKIVVGTIMMAIAVNSIFEVLNIVFGGVTGIGIIIKKYFPIPLWLTNMVLNIPLFVIGFRLFGRRTMIRTFVATTLLTIFLGIMPAFNILAEEKIVSVIIGSILMGAGLGLIFSTFTSGGGTDLMAMIINSKLRHVSIPKILAVIDSAVVVAGMIFFGPQSGFYSLITVYLIAKVSDTVMEGPDSAKLIYIISEHYSDIANYILNAADRGVSAIEVEGMYTHNVTKMLLCVVYAKEMVNIKEKVYKIDKNAICFVGDIREAFGEGFTKYDKGDMH